MPEVLVWACWASGADVAPLVAVVTALSRVHMQRDVAAYRDWAMRSSMWRARRTEVVRVVLILLITGVLIAGFLRFLPVTLEGCGCASGVMHAYVECGMGDVTIEGSANFDVLNVGGRCEVFEGVHGDVVLMGEDVS